MLEQHYPTSTLVLKFHLLVSSIANGMIDFLHFLEFVYYNSVHSSSENPWRIPLLRIFYFNSKKLKSKFSIRPKKHTWQITMAPSRLLTQGPKVLSWGFCSMKTTLLYDKQYYQHLGLSVISIKLIKLYFILIFFYHN